MPIPIICGTCDTGRYRPSGALYVCTACGHELSRSDFVLDPGEQLVEHDGTMHTRERGTEGPARYTITPTHRIQAAHVCATLARAVLRFPSPFSRADEVYAANELKHGHRLTDEGPWELTLTELRTVHIALRWRHPSGRPIDPRHQAIANAVRDAHEQAAADATQAR
ncbi:hypothetical protein ACFV3E_40795 [Streptomyces sp. NPDC059718]